MLEESKAMAILNVNAKEPRSAIESEGLRLGRNLFNSQKKIPSFVAKATAHLLMHRDDTGLRGLFSTIPETDRAAIQYLVTGLVGVTNKGAPRVKWDSKKRRLDWSQAPDRNACEAAGGILNPAAHKILTDAEESFRSKNLKDALQGVAPWLVKSPAAFNADKVKAKVADELAKLMKEGGLKPADLRAILESVLQDARPVAPAAAAAAPAESNDGKPARKRRAKPADAPVKPEVVDGQPNF